MRNGLSVLLGLVALGAAASATADVLTVKFNGTDGVTSSLRFPDHIFGGGENGWFNFNHNTGGQQGTVVFSHPVEDWYYPITLFRANLSSIPAGSTINSVQFVLGNSWWNGQTWTGVEVREVNVPGAATWQPGNGTYGNRNTAEQQDLGAGQWFADLTTIDPVTKVASGIAWDGTVKNMYDIRGNWGSPDPLQWTYANTAAGAMTTLLGSGNVDAGAGLNTFNGNAAFTALVQGWLNGTTQNDGFALSAMNSQRTDGGDNATNLFSMAPDGAGLIIDYTPVPEPALIGTLAAGSLVMLRRRHRTA